MIVTALAHGKVAKCKLFNEACFRLAWVKFCLTRLVPIPSSLSQVQLVSVTSLHITFTSFSHHLGYIKIGYMGNIYAIPRIVTARYIALGKVAKCKLFRITGLVAV